MSKSLAPSGLVALVATFLVSACVAPPAPSEPVAIPATPAEQPEDSTGIESPQAPTTNLQTYDGTAFNFPLKAQYPDTMQIEAGCAGEGCGFFFTFRPQGNGMDAAEVHVFLPAGTATAAEQEVFVTGPNGLIENAEWTVNSTEPAATTEFAYPWTETVISFSTDQEETGHILLGQTNGQAVQVLLKYPSEMADAYWRDAKVVLDNLEFVGDLLPLSPSAEGGV